MSILTGSVGLARNSRLALLASVSAAAIGLLAAPALAGDIQYTDGQTDSTALDLSDEDYALITDEGVTATHSGVISGARSISKEGAGQLTLSGINTYSGGTTINAGTLALSSSDAAGSGTIMIRDGATLGLTASSAMTLANDVELQGDATLDTAQHAAFAGVFSGSGRLVKNGGGTLTLTSANLYSGGTLIRKGTIHVTDDDALGTGDVTFGEIYQENPTLSYADGVTIGNDLISSETTILRVDSGTATQNGTAFAARSSVFYFKEGAGELIINGAMKVAMGMGVRGGTLTAATENVLDNYGRYSPEAAGTLRIAANQQIAALTGQGIVDLTSRRLTIASGSGGASFDGTLIGDDDAELRKSGKSSLTLNGDGSNYFGRVTLEDGFLQLNGNFAGTPIFVNGGRLSGRGTVGDVAVDAGILMGKDGQTLSIRDLTLTQNSIIEAQLGTENAAPLFDVAGDIVLDGTLNVVNLGGFGRGIYRLFDYAGGLDDRGLEIGTVPDGYDADNLSVQTSVAGQINVVADDPDYGPVWFWDGDDSSKWNNGTVDGGDGHWRRGGNVFTDSRGIANGGMNPLPAFVVFTGQAGKVNVDTGFGEIHPDGMQFAVDGYQIGGEMISWDAGERIVRVGDGTAAGAGYTAEISASIDGGGRLVKTDLGMLILSGQDFAYRGGTEVREGTLLINDGTIGDVDVLTQGRLGGNGSVQNADVAGTLVADHAIGTFTVDGDLTMREDSVLEVSVDADGNGGRIDITGTAHIEGGRVVTLASGGNYAPLTTYTILSAEGGVEGQFDGVEANLAFLTAALNYGDKDVQLALTRNSTSFGNVGVTHNQIATGEAIEPLGAGNAIYDRVLTLSEEDARGAFDQVSGEIHASVKGVLANESRQVRDAVSDRVDAAFARLGLGAEQQGIGPNFWTSASASQGVLNSDGNAARTSYAAGNLFIGADAMFNSDWLLGFVAGMGQSSLDASDRNSRASSTNYHVGLYGGGEVSDFTFKFGAAYSHHSISTTRNPAFAGFTDSLTADYAGNSAQAFGEIGHKFRFDSGLIVEPFVNLALVNVQTGGYGESGGAAALTSDGGAFSAGVVSVGVRGSQQFLLGDGKKAELKGAIGWTHVAASTPETTHALGGNAFTVAGAPIQGDALNLKAGFGLALSEKASLDIGYTGQLGSQGQTHGINGSLSVKF